MISTSGATATEADGAPPFPGLPDHLEVIEKLGAGGFGAVFSVRDKESGQTLALKRLQRVDANSIYRFKQEFRTMQGRSHPNLVRLVELFAVNDSWCFTMDRVDGVPFDRSIREDGEHQEHSSETLSTRQSDEQASPTTSLQKAPSYDAAPLSSRRGRLGDVQPPAFNALRLRTAFRQLVQGVLELHAAGVLHRDLKPSNVLVEASGRLVILDFGLALTYDRTDFRERSRAGTPAYMSPEQARGAPLTMASDWYSVGVMLYEALTGRLPFGGTNADMLQARCTRDPRDPRQLVSSLPEDLCDLCMALLQREAVDRPNGAAICKRVGLTASKAASPHHVSGGVFVGRERELHSLHEAFKETCEGRTVVVHVHGPSGFGKTTLVRKFLSQLTLSRDIVALEGRCYERESVPFKALDDLVDALGRYLGGLRPVEAASLMPRDTRALLRLFPSLGRLEFLSELPGRPASNDIHELRRRAFIALRDLLARISDTRPLLLVLEDVHWGDRDSAELIRDLLAPPDVPRLLLIASYRDDGTDENVLLRTLRCPQALDTAWQGVDIPLTPLEERQAEDLALALLGDSTNAKKHARLIARESAQNPLFVTQLVRAARRKSSHAPEISMRGVLLERTRLLTPEALYLLRTLSACEGRLTERQLARSAGVRKHLVPGALDQLRDEQLAVVSTTRSYPEFEIVHDKVREVALENCDAATLREIHLSLARMFRDFGEDAELIARHFLQAGEATPALRWLVVAGDRAASGAAFDRALRIYQQALELSDPDHRLSILDKLAQALRRAGQGVESARALLELAELDVERRAIHLRQAGEQYLLAGHASEALETLKPLLEHYGLTLPKSEKSALASLLYRRARLRLRGYHYRKRATSELCDEQKEAVDLCWTLGHGLAGIDLVRSAYYNAMGVWLALELGEPRRLARSLALDATLRSLEGMDSVRSAQPILKRAEALASEQPESPALGWITAARAVDAWTRTDLEVCEDQCREAIRLMREESEATFREIGSLTVWFWMHAAFLRGNLSLIEQHAPAVAREAEARGDRYTLSTVRTYVLALYWAVKGRPEQGREDADQTISLWPEGSWYHQHWAHLRAHCFLDLYEGQGQKIAARAAEGRRRMKSTFQLRIRTPRLELAYLEGRGLIEQSLVEGVNDLKRNAVRRKIAELDRERNGLATIYSRTLQVALNGLVSPKDAAAQFLQLSAEFGDLNMVMHERAALLRHGQLTGGVQGKSIARAAASSLGDMGVAEPVRFAQMLVPRMTLDSWSIAS